MLYILLWMEVVSAASALCTKAWRSQFQENCCRTLALGELSVGSTCVSLEGYVPGPFQKCSSVVSRLS